MRADLKHKQDHQMEKNKVKAWYWSDALSGVIESPRYCAQRGDKIRYGIISHNFQYCFGCQSLFK